MTVDVNNSINGFANEDQAAQDFLNAIPTRMQQYSRDCVVFNATTGRYEDAGGSNDTSNSGAASPMEGRRAPPPTPATIAAALANHNGGLEPLLEDALTLGGVSRPGSPVSAEVAEEAPAGGFRAEAVVSDSQEDAKTDEAAVVATCGSDSSTTTRTLSPTTATVAAFNVLFAKTGRKGLEASKFASAGVLLRASNSSRVRLSPLATRNHNTNIGPVSPTDSYQDKVVEAFREDIQVADMGGHKTVRFAKIEGDSGSEEVAKDTHKAHGNAPIAAPATDPFTTPALATATTFVTIPATPPVASTATSAGHAAGTIAAAAAAAAAAGVENREDASYFESWGAPGSRSGPEAEVRRVIIKGLPAAADNTFVAGLVHGGALECYHLVKNPNSAVTTAVVTFATGASAKLFYDKYPNGLNIKFRGKKSVALVEIGASVDVISGVMRGYLESGATRVVRAEGCDEDWTMRALRKISEDKNRKLEAIIDTFKDAARNIEFRFTNVADAVTFRGHLIHDVDWEDCSIRFGADPCTRKE